MSRFVSNPLAAIHDDVHGPKPHQLPFQVGGSNFCIKDEPIHEYPMATLFNDNLGGGFKHFLFSPLLGEDFHFDYLICFRWVGSTTN